MTRQDNGGLIVRNDRSGIIVILSILVWVSLLLVPRFIPAVSETLVSINNTMFRVGFFDVLGVSMLIGAVIIASKDLMGRGSGFDATTLIVAAVFIVGLLLVLVPFAPGMQDMRAFWSMGFTTGIGWVAMAIMGFAIFGNRR